MSKDEKQPEIVGEAENISGSACNDLVSGDCERSETMVPADRLLRELGDRIQLLERTHTVQIADDCDRSVMQLMMEAFKRLGSEIERLQFAINDAVESGDVSHEDIDDDVAITAKCSELFRLLNYARTLPIQSGLAALLDDIEQQLWDCTREFVSDYPKQINGDT